MYSSRSLTKEAMREKAMSWNKENTASAIPAASPSFPVAGAAMKAATTTRTRMKLTRIVAKYWNALAAVSEVTYGWDKSQGGEGSVKGG